MTKYHFLQVSRKKSCKVCNGRGAIGEYIRCQACGEEGPHAGSGYCSCECVSCVNCSFCDWNDVTHAVDIKASSDTKFFKKLKHWLKKEMYSKNLEVVQDIISNQLPERYLNPPGNPTSDRELCEVSNLPKWYVEGEYYQQWVASAESNMLYLYIMVIRDN